MSLPSLSALLAELEHAVRKGTAIVVFDLDDTLFLTANRHLRILREFAGVVESENAAAAAVLRSIPREQLRYSIIETVESAGADGEIAQRLRPFWFERFFRNEYLLEDDPLEGACDYVREVLSRGGEAVYFTGRDESMRQGTEASLRRHGFPLDGRGSRLVLKPRFETPDSEYKSEGIADIIRSGTVVGTFENEPSHVNLFAERIPGAMHFLLETKHSGKPVVPYPGAGRIKDFRF